METVGKLMYLESLQSTVGRGINVLEFRKNMPVGPLAYFCGIQVH